MQTPVCISMNAYVHVLCEHVCVCFMNVCMNMCGHVCGCMYKYYYVHVLVCVHLHECVYRGACHSTHGVGDLRILAVSEGPEYMGQPTP